jgi:DNA-binding IscR family transcriptional regulator
MRLSCRLREKLALAIMQLIGHSFHHNEPAWSIQSLSVKINISEQALMIIMPALLSNKLVMTTGDDNQYYMPGQSLENITLGMILKAARTAEETSQLNPDDIETPKQVKEAVTNLERAISDSANDKTLRDLVQD